ncbi:HAD family hydrolase [Paenisporosarcina antarctica]|uniref:Phosphoserine phosphatase n=1 Tax=Paenisporosarcina antarctica TaxID=417367 RepID=A0A4P6ZUC7_9BACL|nr:HAD family hydrolase [Paenisporosarcina antarctica]QBP39931.1 HAD family hydrolase [Paenisporosarcina antarctica]
MIKTIIFDLDDTLLWDKKSVEVAFQETCQFAAKKLQIDPALLEEAVRFEASELYASYETFPFTKMIGINPFEGLWGTFDDVGEQFQKMKEIVPGYRIEAWTRGLRRMDIDDPELGKQLAEYFPKARKANPFIYKETFQVLERLKDYYQLVLLTNGSPTLQKTKLEITSEIAPYFTHIIISGAFGRGKPDPSIFEFALSQSNLQADEAIMVGDNLMTDILGASRAGIRSVWINRELKQPDKEVKPTYEITNLEELFSILENL